MKMTRRQLLEGGAGFAAASFFDRVPVMARVQGDLIQKPIPSTKERIPVIGLGSWRTFNLDLADADARGPIEVLRRFHELGGRVVDTAPSYGRSEGFVGAAANQLSVTNDLFMATKVNVEGKGAAAAVDQMENSRRVLGKGALDLMQVWNLGDNFRDLTDRHLAAHMEAVRDWKANGGARHIGITTSFPRQYEDMEAALRRYEMDFVQLDYSIGDRVPEERLLPLAAERGVAVLVNRPFSTGNLFGRVSGKTLPSWAAEFDCASWAQFFLKFIVSHPAVTCTIPATSDPGHLIDNMGACRGRLPDEQMRVRMAELFETL